MMVQHLSGKRTRRAALVLVGLLSLHGAASAGTVKGRVDSVRTHDALPVPGSFPPLFYFTLKDIAQVGNCPTFQGAVLFAGGDRQMLDRLLAAQATGQEVIVTFDDVLRANGWCVSTDITIGHFPSLLD